MRDKLTGQFLPGANTPFEDRYWSKVVCDLATGCWLWCGVVGKHGYGVITIGHSDQRRAHIEAWKMVCPDPLPSWFTIGHTCDVPICVRNDGDEGTYEVAGVSYRRFGHLFLTTDAGNLADMRAKGRGSRPPRWNSILTLESAELIRARYKTGGITQKELAAEYGVSSSAIGNLIAGWTWTKTPRRRFPTMP